MILLFALLIIVMDTSMTFWGNLMATWYCVSRSDRRQAAQQIYDSLVDSLARFLFITFARF